MPAHNFGFVVWNSAPENSHPAKKQSFLSFACLLAVESYRTVAKSACGLACLSAIYKIVNEASNFPVYWLLHSVTVNHNQNLFMKLLFSRKTMLAVALAAAAAVGCVSQANEQPLPPSAGEAALPPGIVPGSQLAQVFKLVQAGLDAGVIKTFVANSAGAFELDADKIITLNDAGVPSEIINAMMERDKNFYAAAATPPPAPPASPAPAVETAPPVTQVTVTYFNDTLSPYGSWLEVDGYGRCWRPTVVNYDSTWRPYCDRGHWVYTDCGWYWDSEYAWGSTFHYGRWFRHSNFGWCWYPDTEWGPSWVTFRSSSDYCGWAPLPPLAVFRPGFGFFYRGASVAIGFDFGLDAGCFTFVSPDRFCDRRPRYYSAGPQRVTQIFNQTTVINNYGNNNTTIVNNGISVQQISTQSHRPIQPVTVAALPNATRHGWRGEGSDRPAHGDNHGNNVGNDNNNAARNLANGGGQPGQTASGQNRIGDQRNSGNGVSTGRPASPQVNGNRSENNDRNNQRDQGNISRKPQPQPKPVVGAPADNQGQTVYRMDRRNSGGGGDRVQPPQAVTPSVNNAAPDRNQRQYNGQPNGNGRNQAENNSRNYREPPSPRQFNAPSAPVSSAPQNEWRQNRSAEAPGYSAPVARSAPQIEPRQFTPPPVQERVQERVQQREQRVEQRVEQRQSVVESAPRSYSPPPAPASAPAPAPSPSHSSERSSDRGSDHGSGHNSDKDK